jgi:HTH-type transcriptional regulator, quorum sensing regulator NprR
MTQHELAKGLASTSLISQIESGRVHPSEHILKSLAQRLHVDVEYFADDMARKEQSHLYRRAKSLIGLDRYLEAADLLAELVQSPPPQVRITLIYNDLAQCYARAGRLEEAAEVYEILADLSISSGDTSATVHSLFQLGHLWRQLHQLDRARMYWSRASELLHRHPELKMPVAMRVHANLGRLLFQEGKVDEAKLHYHAAAELAEQFSASLDLAVVTHGLANVAVAQGQFEEAQDLTDKAKQMYAACGHDRGVNQCRVNRVHLLRKMGRIDEALHFVDDQRLTSSFRNDTLRCANLLMEGAMCKQEAGDTLSALRMAEEAAASIKPESERWPYLQAIVIRMMMEMGHHEDALTRIDSVLSGTRRPSAELTDEWQELKCKALLHTNDTDSLLEEGTRWLKERLDRTLTSSLFARSVSFPAE